MNWEECPVLVTGGASFISSHLVDELVLRGAKVTVVDDLSNGKKDNLEKSLDKIKFIQQNLEYISKKEINELNGRTKYSIQFIRENDLLGKKILNKTIFLSWQEHQK